MQLKSPRTQLINLPNRKSDHVPLFDLFSRELKDKHAEASSASGLGQVHAKMGDWASALTYHQLDLGLSEEVGDPAGQIRALSDIGAAYEGMEDWDKAIEAHEQFLEKAIAANDPGAQTQALGGLGKDFVSLRSYTKYQSFSCPCRLVETDYHLAMLWTGPPLLSRQLRSCILFSIVRISYVEWRDQ